MLCRLEIQGPSLEPEHRALVAARLRSGALIVYPTETLYALGCDPRDAGAVQRLVALKGRVTGKPLPLIAASVEAARTAVSLTDVGTARLWELLTEHFWPGPLTLVAPARDGLATAVTAGTGCVGIRVSGLPLAREVAAAGDGLIVSTSASRSGEGVPGFADGVAAVLGGGVDLVLDAGPRSTGVPSTVLAISNGVPGLLRQGSILSSALVSLLGREISPPGLATSRD